MPSKRPKKPASRAEDEVPEVVDLVSDEDDEEEQADASSLACPKCTLLNELATAAKHDYKCELCGASLRPAAKT